MKTSVIVHALCNGVDALESATHACGFTFKEENSIELEFKVQALRG